MDFGRFYKRKTIMYISEKSIESNVSKKRATVVKEFNTIRQIFFLSWKHNSYEKYARHAL